MHPLHIALHDGFRDSTVTLTSGGKQLYHQTGVTTDLTISRAGAVDTQVSAQATIAAAVEPGHLRGSITLDARSFPYLAISVMNGKIEFKPSKEFFRYM